MSSAATLSDRAISPLTDCMRELLSSVTPLLPLNPTPTADTEYVPLPPVPRTVTEPASAAIDVDSMMPLFLSATPWFPPPVPFPPIPSTMIEPESADVIRPPAKVEKPSRTPAFCFNPATTTAVTRISPFPVTRCSPRVPSRRRHCCCRCGTCLPEDVDVSVHGRDKSTEDNVRAVECRTAGAPKR